MGTRTNANNTGWFTVFEFDLDVFNLNERFAGIFCRDIHRSLYLYGVVPFLLILLTLWANLRFHPLASTALELRALWAVFESPNSSLSLVLSCPSLVCVVNPVIIKSEVTFDRGGKLGAQYVRVGTQTRLKPIRLECREPDYPGLIQHRMSTYGVWHTASQTSISLTFGGYGECTLATFGRKWEYRPSSSKQMRPALL